MPRAIVILLATSMVALLGALGSASADVVYQWTDAHGEVHYSDQWVPGAKVIMTSGPQAPGASSNAMQGIESESKAASAEVKQEEEAQTVQQDEAKARAKQCEQAKANYTKLIQSRRVFTTDSSGERHYLSDSDADALRLKAREAMDAACGDGSSP